MSSRRGRQARVGQKFTATPGDLRVKGPSGPVRRVIVLRDAGDAWPCAEDLAPLPDAELALVSVDLDGRRIDGTELVACYRWLFGSTEAE